MSSTKRSSSSTTACIGCGAVVPVTRGPTHRYLGASPGCWEAYGHVLAREFGDVRYFRVHDLTVDAYAAQHPGSPSPQTIRSAAVHLVSLCMVIERDLPVARAAEAKRSAVTRKLSYFWLEPPDSPGEVTVLDVRRARDAEEHHAAAWEWARSVWSAWSTHHPTVREWADAI